MDNLFTTVPLLEVLDANGYHGTGTVRVNRLGKSCPLADTADFKRTEIESMRSVQTIIASSLGNCCIRLIQWLDNGVVTQAISVFGINPQSNSKRWWKTQKKNVNIPTPKAVREYSLGMGGTDRMDQNMNTYRVSIRGKNGSGLCLHGFWMLVCIMLDYFVK